MSSRLITATLLTCLALTGPAMGQSWGKQTDYPQFAKSKAICRRLEDRQPPQADRPTPAQSRALKGCDSEALYYGEGGPPDYAKARLCAFEEGAGRGVFSGPTILMQLYANGLGVKRDLDQAIAYACNLDGAPAESDGRVNSLEALKTHPSAKRFDYCDDITSGMSEGMCAAREQTIAQHGRDARSAVLAARSPPAARKAFATLSKAADAYAGAVGDEVDQSGTARAAMSIGAEEAVRDAFMHDAQALLDNRWPAAGPAQAKAADASLNAAYRKAMDHLGSKDNLTTVKPADVRKVQRAWIAYRDAFIAFAAAARPALGAPAVTARLSAERTKMLADMVG